ncbi:MAG TPA: RICIN domain-containing protein, partial [Cellvibrio sp.]|nr:RICIN domain-containing protein [Cellvibrio sp.]
VANCASGDGSNVQQWSWLNNDCQKWRVTSIGDGYYRLSPVVAPTKALDVDGISTADGANVMLWEYWGGQGQQFRFQSAGNGRWRIVARHSGKCLDVSGVSQNDGANLNQWSCISNGLNQQFQMTRIQ